MTKYYKTANYRIEQFLFMHDICWIGQSKNEDNYTVWEYLDTPELERIVAEYWEIDKRRRERRERKRTEKEFIVTKL